MGIGGLFVAYQNYALGLEKKEAVRHAQHIDTHKKTDAAAPSASASHASSYHSTDENLDAKGEDTKPKLDMYQRIMQWLKYVDM